MSPDLNLIEHVWDELGRRIRANHQINTLQDLQAALVKEWQASPNALLQRYVNFMRRGIMAVIRAQGGHTRYEECF